MVVNDDGMPAAVFEELEGVQPALRQVGAHDQVEQEVGARAADGGHGAEKPMIAQAALHGVHLCDTRVTEARLATYVLPRCRQYQLELPASPSSSGLMTLAANHFGT